MKALFIFVAIIGFFICDYSFSKEVDTLLETNSNSPHCPKLSDSTYFCEMKSGNWHYINFNQTQLGETPIYNVHFKEMEMAFFYIADNVPRRSHRFESPVWIVAHCPNSQSFFYSITSIESDAFKVVDRFELTSEATMTYKEFMKTDEGIYTDEGTCELENSKAYKF